MRGVAKLSLGDKLRKPRSVALLVKEPSIGRVALLSSSARRSDGQARRTSHRFKACEIDPPLHQHKVDDGLVRAANDSMFLLQSWSISTSVLCALGREQDPRLGAASDACGPLAWVSTSGLTLDPTLVPNTYPEKSFSELNGYVISRRASEHV